MIGSFSLADYGDAFFGLLFTQIWQVALLALTVGLLVRWFAQDRPHLAHALWVLVLIKCITPPVLASPISPFTWLAAATETAEPELVDAVALEATQLVTQPAMSDDVSSTQNESLPPIVVHVDRTAKPKQLAEYQTHDFSTLENTMPSPAANLWTTWCIRLWIAGVAISCAIALIRWLFFFAWVQRRRCDADFERELESTWLEPIQQQVGLSRPVRLMVTDSLVGPAVIGLWQPTVLLPRQLIDENVIGSKPDSESSHHRDSPQAILSTLLAHELVHIRRGDLWWSLLQTMAGCLFWFHPLVWWACRKVTQESERSCDEETIAALDCSPVSYAKNLIEVLEWKHRLRAAPVVPGIRPIDITTARLERVMKLKNGCKQRTPWSTWLVLGLSCCLVLPGAAFGLRAQEKQNDTQENSPASKPSSVAIEQGSAWILNHQQKEGSWWQKVDTDQRADQDPKPPQEPKTGSSPANDHQAETQPSAPGQVLPSAYYLGDDIQYFPKGPDFKLERAAHAFARADQKLPPGQDTSQPLQEKNTEQLNTYSWSISNVLERARQRSYSENMTPEAAVVTYFSRRFPATGNVSLFDDQLSITMTAKEAKAIGFLLDNWRKHGLDEIVTETRFFVVDPEKLETLKLDWEVSRPIVSQTEQQNDIPFLANLPYMSRVFSNVQVDAHGVEKIGVDLEVDKNGGFKATNRQATVQSAAFTTSSYLSLHTFLDDKQVRSLVGQVKQDASSNVLQAPTTRTLLGQPAQVVDAVKRPFVTEFRRADPNQPLSAKNCQPIVKLINEGRTIKQRVTENADGALSLNWGITIEAITDVDTIDMSIVSKGMALQQPRVSTRKIKSKLTLPKGKNTAAFCYFDKDQRGESKAFLVTATVRKITFESQINTPTLNWTPNQAKPAQINPIKAGKLQAPSPPPPAFDYHLTAANGTAQKGSEDANQTIAGWLKNRGFLTQVSGDVEFKISDDRSLAEISGREFRFSSSDRDHFILAGGKGTLKIKSDNSETVSIEAVLTGKSEVRYEDMNLKADAIKFRIAAENDQEVFTFELSGNAQAFDDSGDSRFIADRIEWVYQPLKEGEKPQIIALLYGNANIQMKLSPDDRQPMNIKGDNLRILLESSTFEAF